MVLDEFLFADDMAKGAPTEEKMQKGVGQVSDSCDSYDRTISIKKTDVIGLFDADCAVIAVTGVRYLHLASLTSSPLQ